MICVIIVSKFLYLVCLSQFMNRENISLNSGNLFSSDADMIVIPVSTTGTVSDRIRNDAQQFLNWEMPRSFPYSQLGHVERINHSYYRNDKEDGHVAILIVTCVDNNFSNLETIENVASAIAEQTLTQPLLHVACPLIGTGAGGLDFTKVYETLVKSFFLQASEGSKLTIYTNSQTIFDRIDAYREIIWGEILGDAGQSLPQKDYEDFINVQQFYLVGAMWDRDDQADRFFNQSIWENGHEEKFAKIVKEVNIGSHLILKSTFAKTDVSFLRVKGWGIVTGNPGNGRQLEVNWAIKQIQHDIPDMGGFRNAIMKINERTAKAVIKALPDWRLLIDSLFQVILKNVNELAVTDSKLVLLENDADQGADLLDIEEDIKAFARLMAYKDFRPPLAIALFGQWGTGKSFFMHKLIKRVKSYAEDRESDDYCSGIAQIHFNAWSYLDANLWASMVSRIFESLNGYINKDEIAKVQRDKIEQALGEKMSITFEEVALYTVRKKTLTDALVELNLKKNGLDEKLDKKIHAVGNRTLTDVIKKVNEEFGAKEKVEKALKENDSLIAVKGEMGEIVPKELWDDPKKAYEHAKSFGILIKAFFKNQRWFVNVIILLSIGLLFYLTPKVLLALTDVIGGVNFKTPFIQGLIQYGLIIVLPFLQRLYKVINKRSKLIKALLMIKVDYDKEINKIKEEHALEEKTLSFEIEKSQKEAESLTTQILSATQELDVLEFKKTKALNTEALYTFIENRYSSEEYRKHLGLVSIIRNDLEVLSALFDGHRKESDGEKFKKMFDRPLQRIILYIDDLDRCPSDRVVEVLEAVNLLMAFPLFIVVVGVDPRWVKNALKSNYRDQELLAEDYLEKIFQIPFHLKPASDESIKNMIRTLSESKPESKDKINDSSSEGLSLTEVDIREFVENAIPTASPIAVPESVNKKNDEEYLLLSEEEVANLEGMSVIIGNNPRAVKRLVNVYRLMRAHESLVYREVDKDRELLIIMFTLALFFGRFKRISLLFRDYIYAYNNGARKLREFLHEGAEDDLDLKLLKFQLDQALTGKSIYNKLMEVDMNTFTLHMNFISRFTFADLYVEN
jgi:hypothetical protein